MFDPAIEHPIRLHDVPRLRWIPGRRGNSRLNLATVYRWASDGLHGIKLETLKIGGTRVTSEAALKRFFEALTTPAVAAGIERPARERAGNPPGRTSMRPSWHLRNGTND